MDTELTPALERVAASVVETNRRRKQLEDELAAASAAVAALQHQSTSLEASMSDLREQLEEALVAHAHEDAALEELSAGRAKVIETSEALRAQIEGALAEKTDAYHAMQSQIQTARRALASVDAEIQEVKTRVGSITDETARVQDALALVRQSADAAQTALADVTSKTRDLDTATDGMAARVCRIAESLDHAERNQKHIAAGSDSLAKLSAKLDSRQGEAEAAAEALHALSKDRQESAARIAEHLAKLDELCATSATLQSPATSSQSQDARATSVPPPPSAPAQSPQTTPSQSQDARANSQSPPPSAPATASHYEETRATLRLLSTQGLLTQTEAANAAELLDEGGVDKLVRSWWSRAMAGPSPGYYRLIIGQALAEANDAKGALTFFNRAMEGKPVDPFITYLVARALLLMKRYVDVLRIAQGLGKTKHGKALALNIEALHLAGTRRYDEAESKLSQALATPGFAKLHYSETLYNLATLASDKGDARAATAWYEKLQSTDPTYRDIANHIQQNGVPVGAR